MSRIFYDITKTITPDILVYPGDPAVRIDEILSIKKGAMVNLSMITLCSHTGTHIDAPKHFYDQGLAIDQLSIEYFIGKAKVFEFMACQSITKTDLQQYQINQADIILCKTKNSALMTKKEFEPQFTYLEPEAAQYLADIGIKTLGFDYLTIDPYGTTDFKAHYILLGNNIVIIEGLNLTDIVPGEYLLIALPLKIQNVEACPARVVLIKDDGGVP